MPTTQDAPAVTSFGLVVPDLRLLMMLCPSSNAGVGTQQAINGFAELKGETRLDWSANDRLLTTRQTLFPRVGGPSLAKVG